MNQSAFEEIAAWVTKSGLIGRTESELMAGFCRRLLDAGISLARAMVILDTLHPKDRVRDRNVLSPARNISDTRCSSQKKLGILLSYSCRFCSSR